jgi:hypothetical protein
MNHDGLRLLSSALFLVFAGCASSSATARLGPEHPASPSAAEAAVSLRSTALADAPMPPVEKQESSPTAGHGHHHGMHGGGQ